MDRQRQIFGKTISCSTVEALLLLETAVCEGLLLSPHWSQPDVANLFGRKTNVHQTTDLSYLTGMAGGGLRTAAFVRAAELSANTGHLRELVRNHIPALIVCQTGWSEKERAPLAALKESGCFVLSAASAQEAIHLAVVGHRAAELSLTPGVLLVETQQDEKASTGVVFPASQVLSKLLGDPDEPIPTPTPAQQMIFGKNRRRVPNWYQFDYPTITGAGKTGLPAALEYAANTRFFESTLSELLEEGFSQLQEAIPQADGPLLTHQVKDAKYLLLSSGTSFVLAAKATDQLRADTNTRVGCIHLAQVYPLPETALSAKLSGKNAITWLEPGTTHQDILPKEALKNQVSVSGKNAPEWYRGRLSMRPDLESILAVFQNMLPKGGQQTDFFVGIEFVRTHSEYPQHEILLQSIQRNFPEAAQWSLSVEQAPANPSETAGSSSLPPGMHRQKDLGPPYARATRFYQDVAVLHADGALHELVADPFQAIPVAPAGTAQLAGIPPGRTELPAFNPALCTGCGECLLQCPHAALPPLAIRVEQLLRGAMDLAGKRGTPLSQLTPLLKNLGKTAGQLIQEKQDTTLRAADFLPEVFARLADQMQLDAGKRESIQAEIEQVVEVLAPMPFAVTESFFTRPELYEKGSGALFTLALDTQACTGCGICAAVCAPQALSMTAETQELKTHALATQEIWEQLPDTAPEIVLRQSQDADYNPFAAILLSRYNYKSLSGPGTDATAPRKALLHLITALTESITQPNLAAQCREIEQTVKALSENIHTILGDALPPEGSQALADTITAAEGKRLSLDELIGKLATREHLKLVDTAVLQRKIQLVNTLKDLLWTLKEGPTGQGRARYGLFFAGEQPEEESNFPFHPFQAPALISSGGSIETALGLFEANLRHTIDNIRLIRRAKLEVKNQYRPELHAAAIAGLDWDQLDEEEKKLVPPLLVICHRDRLPSNFIEQLPFALSTNYPIKIFVLDNGALQPAAPAELSFGIRNMLLQSAMSTGNSPVFMGSAANPQVLFENLLEGIRAGTPALFVLFCPELAKHAGSGPIWPEISNLAMNSRAFPFFNVHPKPDNIMRASGISLRGNPSESASWVVLSNSDNGTQVTFADWLFSLSAWEEHFRQLTEADPQACNLETYLKLDSTGREGKNPVYYRHAESGEVTYGVSSQVIEACQAALSNWNYLREMAGSLSAHPQKVWEEAEKALVAQFDARLKEVEKGYEERINNLEQEFLEKTRVQLRERLLTLAMNKRLEKN